jgi:hypothetical protein
MPDLPLGRDDFIALLRLETVDLKDFMGLAIREDGVYVIRLPDSVPITSEERAAWPHHPLGDPSQPLFTFPCTESEAVWLEEWLGLPGYIEREDLERWRAEKAAEIAPYLKARGLCVGAKETAAPALLISPKHKDDWFLAILDTVKAFVAEHGRMPGETEAWARLSDNPPASVKRGLHRKREALFLGRGALDRDAFRKRWKRYTKEK